MMLEIQSLLFSLEKKKAVSAEVPTTGVAGLTCAHVEPTACFVSVIILVILLYVVTKT
jgi:hypothetical protein